MILAPSRAIVCPRCGCIRPPRTLRTPRRYAPRWNRVNDMLATAGKFMRDPTTGKMLRDPTTGKFLLHTAGVSTCCCDEKMELCNSANCNHNALCTFSGISITSPLWCPTRFFCFENTFFGAATANTAFSIPKSISTPSHCVWSTSNFFTTLPNQMEGKRTDNIACTLNPIFSYGITVFVEVNRAGAGLVEVVSAGNGIFFYGSATYTNCTHVYNITNQMTVTCNITGLSPLVNTGIGVGTGGSVTVDIS